MNSRSIRSLLLSVSLFIFMCLFFSGSYRLIGHEEGAIETESPRVLCSIPTQMTAPPTRDAENVSPQHSRHLLSRRESAVLVSSPEIPVHVLCDANGNVLGRRSYMHEVYYVFTLGDGFA